MHEKSIGNTLLKLTDPKLLENDDKAYFVEDIYTSPDFKLDKCKPLPNNVFVVCRVRGRYAIDTV